MYTLGLRYNYIPLQLKFINRSIHTHNDSALYAHKFKTLQYMIAHKAFATKISAEVKLVNQDT